MDKRIIAVTSVVILILAATGCNLISAGSAETERISVEQLQGMLGRTDVIVVDVRSNSDWNKSELKIKGAVREELSAISSRIDTYPKGKTLVFYCA